MGIVGEAIVMTRGNGQTPYQTIVKFGQRGLRLHIFYRGDTDPDMHDHPADFWTFPLTSYVEEIEHPWSMGHTEWRLVRAFRFHRRRAEFRHRLLGRWTGERWSDGTPRLAAGEVVTVVWWGAKRREWGFWTKDGFVHWEQYVDTRP